MVAAKSYCVTMPCRKAEDLFGTAAKKSEAGIVDLCQKIRRWSRSTSDFQVPRQPLPVHLANPPLGETITITGSNRLVDGSRYPTSQSTTLPALPGPIGSDLFVVVGRLARSEPAALRHHQGPLPDEEELLLGEPVELLFQPPLGRGLQGGLRLR